MSCEGQRALHMLLQESGVGFDSRAGPSRGRNSPAFRELPLAGRWRSLTLLINVTRHGTWRAVFAAYMYQSSSWNPPRTVILQRTHAPSFCDTMVFGGQAIRHLCSSSAGIWPPQGCISRPLKRHQPRRSGCSFEIKHCNGYFIALVDPLVSLWTSISL